MAGIGALVHLAATPDEADFLTSLLPDPVVGLHHVLEQARPAGVPRVILASTGQLFRGHAGSFPIAAETPTAPRTWCAATKAPPGGGGSGVRARPRGGRAGDPLRVAPA
jgi:uronate dehydrogenase